MIKMLMKNMGRQPWATPSPLLGFDMDNSWLPLAMFNIERPLDEDGMPVTCLECIRMVFKVGVSG